MNVRDTLIQIRDYDLNDPTKRFGENGHITTRGLVSRFIKFCHLDKISWIKHFICRTDVAAVSMNVKDMIRIHLNSDEIKTQEDNLAAMVLVREAADKVNALIDKVLPKRPEQADLLRGHYLNDLSALFPQKAPAPAETPTPPPAETTEAPKEEGKVEDGALPSAPAQEEAAQQQEAPKAASRPATPPRVEVLDDEVKAAPAESKKDDAETPPSLPELVVTPFKADSAPLLTEAELNELLGNATKVDEVPVPVDAQDQAQSPVANGEKEAVAVHVVEEEVHTPAPQEAVEVAVPAAPRKGRKPKASSAKVVTDRVATNNVTKAVKAAGLKPQKAEMTQVESKDKTDK